MWQKIRHWLHSSQLLGGPFLGIVYARERNDLWVGQACLICGEIEAVVCLPRDSKNDMPAGLKWTWTHERVPDESLADCVRAILAKNHLPYWRNV